MTSNTKEKAKAVRNSMKGVAMGLSDSADRVADILIDDGSKHQGHKARKIKDETVLMFKDARKLFKSELKDVKASDFVSLGAYGVGKVSAYVRHGFLAFLKELE